MYYLAVELGVGIVVWDFSTSGYECLLLGLEIQIVEESILVVWLGILMQSLSHDWQAEERGRLKEELEEARDIARRRSLGNIKFIGELFKLKMLTEAIMHDCVVKLLKNHDEESLECLCRLLTTIGKDLDFEKAKVWGPVVWKGTG